MRAGPDWFVLIEAIGILSFAVNAMIVAKGKDLSAFGIFLCAMMTALGGGTLRDLLLGPAALPFFWVAHPFYLVLIAAVSLGYAASPAARRAIGRRLVLLKDVAETLAMASLAALGAAKAHALLPAVPGPLGGINTLLLCAFLGAMTASFGGLLRDVMLNEFPSSLHPGVWLIEALLAGGAATGLVLMAGAGKPWALLAGFLVIVAVRGAVLLGKAR